MKKLDNFEKSLRKYQLVNRIFIGGLVILGLSQAPSLILGQRNEDIIQTRNEPLIKTQVELEETVRDVRKDLGLDPSVVIDISSRDLSGENRNGYCVPNGKNRYKIVLDLKYRKKSVVEHEVFHAYEMQTSKFKTDVNGMMFRWEYWQAEWRAQNYCLRNYQTNQNNQASAAKTIGVGMIKK